VGRVEEIRIFPVRSLAGVPVGTAEIGPDGLAGDRTWTVVDADGRPVRAKDAPAIAELPGEAADEAVLSAAVGRPVHLAALPTQAGAAPVHLVSRQAVERAARGVVPEGCSADDPRANVLISLDGEDDERSWVGRELRIGNAVLRVTRTPKHCLGVYADVVVPGTAHPGDAVSLIGIGIASH